MREVFPEDVLGVLKEIGVRFQLFNVLAMKISYDQATHSLYLHLADTASGVIGSNRGQQ